MNPLYPVFLDLRGKQCLVVGGGRVAERKIVSLLRAGAAVRVVAPWVAPGIAALARGGAVEVVLRPFRDSDADGACLAVAASDDDEANRAVSAASRARGTFCNVVDRPSLCDFHVPAVLEKGDVKVAVSTGGRCPALASLVRDRLESALGDRTAEAARVLGEWRDALQRRSDLDPETRNRLVKAAVRSGGLADYLDGAAPSFEPTESR